jgi:hypothetical protein
MPICSHSSRPDYDLALRRCSNPISTERVDLEVKCPEASAPNADGYTHADADANQYTDSD